MQNEDKTTENIDEAFEGIPEQVQDFMISTLFKSIVAAIKETLALTDDQAQWVEYLANELLMKTFTMEEAFRFLTNKGITEELAVKIIYLIDTEIITRAINITEFFTDDSEMTEEERAEIDTSLDETVPASSSALATLSDRLKSASIATPSKRDYSLNTPTVSTPAAPRAIDPYHESIDS